MIFRLKRYLCNSNANIPRMKTSDEIQKMQAAMLYVLNQFPDGLDYIKLFKILYFAQQEHLSKYGRGIVNDTFHALRLGPVPAFIYKGIQIAEGRLAQEEDFQQFCAAIAVDNKTVKATQDADLDELSVTDLRCLKWSIDTFGYLPSKKLSEKSHDAAWAQAYNRAQDDPEKDIMSLIDIARAGGANEGMIAYLRENLRLDRMLQ